MSFENIMQFELSNLSSSRSSVENKKVYDMMLHSIKGKFVCEDSRKKFILSRTLNSDQVYNPTSSLQEARSFIDCNAAVLEKSGTKCAKSYEKVYNCISSSKNKFYDFPKNCVNDMEDFIDC